MDEFLLRATRSLRIVKKYDRWSAGRLAASLARQSTNREAQNRKGFGRRSVRDARVLQNEKAL